MVWPSLAGVAANPLVAAGLGAAIVGGIHFAAHHTTGEERYFDEAGVMWAGIAISAATFAVVWFVASTSAPSASFGPADAILGNPVWALLIGLVAFLAFMVAWNRGAWWVVNILAQKEPAVAAVGVALLVWGGGPALIGFVTVGVAAGAFLLALGIVGRYTAVLDL